jgi:hypothetical protein
MNSYYFLKTLMICFYWNSNPFSSFKKNVNDADCQDIDLLSYSGFFFLINLKNGKEAHELQRQRD